jgi:hypothetical protein
MKEVVGRAFEELSYLTLTLLDFSYHLSQISRGLVDLLKYVLDLEKKREKIVASEVLGKLVQIDVHFQYLPMFRGEVRQFRDTYEELRRLINLYSEDLQAPLSPDHQQALKIYLAKLLEYVYLLIAKGLGTFLNPSTLIRAGKFPENLRLKVKIGEDEVVVDRTFVLGRLSDDYLGLRIVPYQMSLQELVEKAKSDTEIEKFPVLFKSRVKIERREYYPITSRLHVVVFYDGVCLRIFDISSSETIIEIDGDARRLIGYRANPYMLPLSLPLGESNKIWIDPVKGVSGEPVELTILR